MNDDSNVMRISALATALSVSRDVVRKLWSSGELPCVPVTTATRRKTRGTTRADFEKFLERRRQSSAAVPSH